MEPIAHRPCLSQTEMLRRWGLFVGGRKVNMIRMKGCSMIMLIFSILLSIYSTQDCLASTGKAEDITIDSLGNFYVTGSIMNVVSANIGYRTIKHDAEGGIVWNNECCKDFHIKDNSLNQDNCKNCKHSF